MTQLRAIQNELRHGTNLMNPGYECSPQNLQRCGPSSKDPLPEPPRHNIPSRACEIPLLWNRLGVSDRILPAVRGSFMSLSSAHPHGGKRFSGPQAKRNAHGAACEPSAQHLSVPVPQAAGAEGTAAGTAAAAGGRPGRVYRGSGGRRRLSRACSCAKSDSGRAGCGSGGGGGGCGRQDSLSGGPGGEGGLNRPPAAASAAEPPRRCCCLLLFYLFSDRPF